MSVIMKCGCGATGYIIKNGEKIKACLIHGCTEEKEVQLDGRFAICNYGNHAKIASNDKLAFFEFRPYEEFDRYYCGCYGYD